MSELKRMTFTSKEVGGGETSKTEWVSLAEYERLKAEVERLRKAGDEMYMTLVDNNTHFEEVWRDKRIYAREAFQGWNHAKEGKQS